MTDLHTYARAAATREGCDPDLFERQIQQESGFDPDAYNAASGATGIAQLVHRFHPRVDARDPRASLDYAAEWMAELHQQFGSWAKALAAYNWGPGNVAHWDGLRGSLPAETQHYLDVILGPGWPEPAPIGEDTGGSPDLTYPEPGGAVLPNTNRLRVTDDGVRLREQPSTSSTVLATLARDTLVTPTSDHAWRPVTYGALAGFIADELLQASSTVSADPVQTGYTFDPTTPTEFQAQDWTCSIRSTMWLLKSIGIAVTPAEAQDAMAPTYVNSDVGLLDASGAGIVEVLADRWGVTAHALPVSFDEAMSLAGQGPLAIGMHNWGGPNHGHWTAVRGKDDGALVLANPAGTGPIYGQQTLDRQAFDARGPASAVFIPIG